MPIVTRRLNDPGLTAAKPWFWLAAGFILLAGLGLGLLSAQGDLAQDEITAVNNATGVHHWWQVFTAIDGDNTHYLTSLYLYALGDGAGTLVRRLPSIVESILAIAAAGTWGYRCGPVVALCSMAVIGLSPMADDYSGVARGYAGLGLFTIMVLDETEYALQHGMRPRLRLAAWVALGFLSHLLMAVSVAGACLWVLWQVWTDAGTKAALRAAVKIFWQAGMAVLPLASLVAWHMDTGQYVIGETIPFSMVKLLGALSLAYQSAAAMPLLVERDYLTGFLIAAGLAIWQFAARPADPRARLYLVMVAGLPALLAAARLQNTSFARYMYPGMIAYLLMLGDMIGRPLSQPLSRPGAGRLAAAACLVVLAAADGTVLYDGIRHGRGDYVAALRRITQDGPAPYGVTERSIAKIVRYGAARYGLPATFVDMADWCGTPPAWVILPTVTDTREHPDPEITAGPDDCPMRFRFVETYPFSRMTGIQYNLYRRG